ncbi:MAG: hypothetical protein ACR2OZ_01715 [Verrucomicrobiales bacterium]
MLRHISPEHLGFHPEKVPASVRIQLPLAPIRQQLSSGRVVVPLRTIVESLDPRLQPAFVRSQLDLNVSVPLAEIFRNLPMGSVPDQARPSQPVAHLFETPFFAKAQEDASRWPAAVPSVLPPAAKTAPAFSGREQTASPSSLPFTPAAEPSSPPFLQISEKPALPAGPASPDFTPGTAIPPKPASTAGQEAFENTKELEGAKAPVAELPPEGKMVRAQQDPQTPPQFLPSWVGQREVAAPFESIQDAGRGPAVLTPTPPFTNAPGEGFTARKKAELPLPEFDEDPIPLESLQRPESHGSAHTTQEGAKEQTSPSGARHSSFGPPARARSGSFVLPPVVPPIHPSAEKRSSIVTPEATRAFSLPPLAEAPQPAAAPPQTLPPPQPAAPPAEPPRQDDSGLDTPAVRSPIEDLTFGYVDDPNQLALRAIFATEKSLRPQDVVDLSSQFPGIRGCLIITPEGVTRSGRLDDSEEVRHFSEKAGALFEKTSSLISELGLGSEQTFTLRTGRSIMSFFTNGTICLAVLHAEPNFQPGVREKLILLTRELAKMLAA